MVKILLFLRICGIMRTLSECRLMVQHLVKSIGESEAAV